MQTHKLEDYPGGKAMPDMIPIFPLDGAVLFPRGRLPLNIFERRYFDMVGDALDGAALIGLVQPRDPGSYARKTQADIYSVGCAGQIVEHEKTDDNRYLIVLKGVSRFRILEEPTMTAAYRQVQVCYDEFTEDRDPQMALGDIRAALLESLQDFLGRMGVEGDWVSIKALSDGDLVHALAMTCPFPGNEKQALLEALTLEERAQVLMTLMALSGSPGESHVSPPSH